MMTLPRLFLSSAVVAAMVKGYNADEARDENGRWTKGGSVTASQPARVENTINAPDNVVKAYEAIADVPPPTAVLAAYHAGQKIAEYAKVNGLSRSEALRDAIYDQIDGVTLPDWWTDSTVHNAFLEEGLRGHELPVRSYGWRYGEIPPEGRSRNHRDDILEPGVSMMAVAGSTRNPDGTFELFNDDRKKVWAVGWLIDRSGTDGEPLLIGAEVVK